MDNKLPYRSVTIDIERKEIEYITDNGTIVDFSMLVPKYLLCDWHLVSIDVLLMPAPPSVGMLEDTPGLSLPAFRVHLMFE